MLKELSLLAQEAHDAITKAYSLHVLDELRIEFLGRKGRLTEVLKKLKDAPLESRKEFGMAANQVKQEIERLLLEKRNELIKEMKDATLEKEWIDVTLPGAVTPEGRLHLVTHTINEITATFHRIGFTRFRAPEVDSEYYAFESLNMPAQHPARDEWETFFIDAPPRKKEGRLLLTPHTSNVQVRAMRELGAPLKIINIARVYRRQSDASHLPMFHQVELLAIDSGLTIADLKGVIEYFLGQFFGATRKLRFRPYHFRFTEPSFEVDIDCDVCHGEKSAGCRVCKEGWLELGGAGMTHVNVLRAGGIDPDAMRGIAFGFGVERITLMRSGLCIPDIRILYENDMRFLTQF